MYERVISLGWFCGPALEMKRIGLRDGSYPFDWMLTHDFSKIISMIEEKDFTFIIMKCFNIRIMRQNGITADIQ